MRGYRRRLRAGGDRSRTVDSVSAVPETPLDAPVSSADLSACRAIHLLTASGIVVGMLAIIAALDGSPRAVILLLVLAQIIDVFSSRRRHT